MAREFSRSERVSSQLQRELALLIQSEVRDPRLGFVTISDVELTRDLSSAKVYFSLLNSETSTIEQNVAILNENVPRLRGFLGKSLKMRSIPQLKFIYDDSIDRGMRMDALLKDIEPGSGY